MSSSKDEEMEIIYACESTFVSIPEARRRCRLKWGTGCNARLIALTDYLKETSPHEKAIRRDLSR